MAPVRTTLDPARTVPIRDVRTSHDGTIRDEIWRRYSGDEWGAFDRLPEAIRRRLNEHAYDAWSVNAFMLWRYYRRLHPTAQRALLRYLDHCERLERQAFAQDYVRRHGSILPHDAAGIPVLRYAATGRVCA